LHADCINCSDPDRYAQTTNHTAFSQRIIQGRAETICDHAEAFGEKCFCHRHTHRSALGEGVMDALRLGGRIDAGGHRKALWLIETLGQAAGGI